jgi:hypothetical protein
MAAVAANPARRLRRAGEEGIAIIVSLLFASMPLAKGDA